MNLIAIIPAGVNDIVVNGLHQWDYGRKLEILSEDLPAMVEVHFACEGMDTAIVHACEAVSGALEVAIPNRCLEQIAPITAWIYAVGENTGVTLKTLILPIIKRARPQPGESIPEDISDKYTEAVGAVNDAVDKLTKGEFTAARAQSDALGRNIHGTYLPNASFEDFSEKLRTGEAQVQSAYRATIADNAVTATNAVNADSASYAQCLDLDGGMISDTDTDEFVIRTPGVYVVLLGDGSTRTCDIIAVPNLSIEVFSDHVKYVPVDAEYGCLKPYNAAGNIRSVIKIALGAAG